MSQEGFPCVSAFLSSSKTRGSFYFTNASTRVLDGDREGMCFDRYFMLLHLFG
jgi:hypothetical protein